MGKILVFIIALAIGFFIGMTFSSGAEGDFIGGFDLTGANSDPTGITTNGTDIWVSDSTDAEVYHYTTAGVFVDSFDTAGDGNTATHGVTHNGTNLFTTDQTLAQIYVWEYDGTFVVNYSGGNAGGGTRGIGTNRTAIFIADLTQDQIYVMDMLGVNRTNWSTADDGADLPTGVAGFRNEVWVTDANDFQVYHYNVDGTFVLNWSIDDETDNPAGIGIDAINFTYIYVVDSSFDNVSFYESNITVAEVLLTSPINNTNVSGQPFLNVSITPEVASSLNLTNTTLRVYNSTGDLWFLENINITGDTLNATGIRVTNLSTDDYTWNYESFQINSTGTFSFFADSNFTFNYTNLTFDSIDFRSNSVEGSIDSFSTIISVAVGSVLSSGNLNYNNTNYAGTIVNLGNGQFNLSRNLLIEDVSTLTNQSFFWEAFLDSGYTENSTSNNQSVDNIILDNCGTNTVRILNYTLVDEDDQTVIPSNANGSIDLTIELFSLDLSTLVSNFSQNYTNVTEAIVCISSEVINNSAFSMFTTAQYGASDYQTEFHHIQNQTLDNESVLTNITLFDLISSRATVFQLVFKDNNFLPVEDAIIQIERQYVSEGVFKSVEAPKTSSNGDTTANLVKDSETYNFVVVKNGTVLSRFDNQIPFCDDSTIGLCFINLNSLAGSGDIFNFDEEIGLIYSFIYDAITRILTFTFTTTTGTSQNVSLHATSLDQLGTTTVCDISLISASGTITCDIPATIGNGTLRTSVLINGEVRFQEFISLGGNLDLGDAGFYLLFVLVLSLAMMFVESKTMTVVSVMIGFIIGALFFFIDGGILFSSSLQQTVAKGTAILWLVITGIILIWKLNSEGRT